MSLDKIEEVLKKYKEGIYTLPQVLNFLKWYPVLKLPGINLDTQRVLRKKVPEIIYAPGKDLNDLLRIIKDARTFDRLILTRLEPKLYTKLKQRFPTLKYKKIAKIAYTKGPPKKREGLVAVVTAGTSDRKIAEEAAFILELLGINVKRYYDVGIAGVHRIFDKLEELEGAKCIIAVAGMEGALPGFIAGLVSKPVIAVPTSVGYGTNLDGWAPLLTMLNSCSLGMAVVNIDNGVGAALMAYAINKL
jgi:hypothetical protein